IKVYELERGDRIKNKEVIIDCLGPEKKEKAQYMEAYDSYRDGTSEEKNDESLVLKITYKPVGFEALFTGDISSKVERDILDSKLSVCDLDFLTVAHHGSKYSSSAEFIKFVNPKIATISVGKGNSYGHPHKETLERFNKYAKATRVFRTDESGQITVVVGGNVKFKRFKERYYNGR
ncbi:MAG: hypothetical protein Q4E99_06145, partial [Bacillota bacterium]|nr:hypothetical protein [Bacillota bacterium]